MSTFSEQYTYFQALAENVLETSVVLPQEVWSLKEMPQRLAEAMRYSLLCRGKRIRPVLLLAAYQSNQDDLSPALPFAAAVECIHTYSLIHDDLPAMDNDDMRRGQPTNHKVYGEALAILAGDALLTLAFELIASSKLPRALDAVRILASRAGANGMIAGQTLDMDQKASGNTAGLVRYIHRRKTADLITAPVEMGFVLGGADEQVLTAARAYGQALGMAFQITDDLLDLKGNPEVTGKAIGRDRALGKLTWPAVVGVEQAYKDACTAVNEAVNAADNLGKNAGFFRSLANSIPKRVK